MAIVLSGLQPISDSADFEAVFLSSPTRPHILGCALAVEALSHTTSSPLLCVLPRVGYSTDVGWQNDDCSCWGGDRPPCNSA